MKIEIAESLILSWLRHVRGCTVTQMNWKPSPRWAVSNEHALHEEFERIRALADKSIGVPVFKKCDFPQFVRQCEIDVLGFAMAQDSAGSRCIAVDSAFHEGGLNYGSADKTVGRVLKKLIRAAFAIEAYLSVGEATIVFATPKLAESMREAIERHLVELDAALANRAHRTRPRLHFRLIANGDFADEILQPTLDIAGEVADTSELFLRARQLMTLCDRPAPRRAATQIPASPPERGEGIGVHVRAVMADFARSGRLNAEIVSQLSSARYSKLQFNLGHPFLKPVDPRADVASQVRDHNGYGRYWKQPLKIGGHQFLMCSQWFNPQRTAFDQWVRDVR